MEKIKLREIHAENNPNLVKKKEIKISHFTFRSSQRIAADIRRQFQRRILSGAGRRW